MVMQLSQVVPWGRSKREYELMFNLNRDELRKNILGCGDGPASFNAELFAEGHTITSTDPLYRYSATEIQQRFEETVDEVLAQVNNNLDQFVWGFHKNPQDLLHNRRQAMALFVKDFAEGVQQGRYVVGELPELPFADNAFELALCSHFLFLYSAHYSFDFHLESIQELLRVASEVRIFPLLTLEQKLSEYVQPIIKRLQTSGYHVTIAKVGYEIQRGGNQMMRVSRV